MKTDERKAMLKAIDKELALSFGRLYNTRERMPCAERILSLIERRQASKNTSDDSAFDQPFGPRCTCHLGTTFTVEGNRVDPGCIIHASAAIGQQNTSEDDGDSLARLSARVEGFKMATDERLRSLDKCQSVQAASIEALRQRTDKINDASRDAFSIAHACEANLRDALLRIAALERRVNELGGGGVSSGPPNPGQAQRLEPEEHETPTPAVSPDEEPKVPERRGAITSPWVENDFYSAHLYKLAEEQRLYALSLERLVAWQRKKLEQSVSRSAAINAVYSSRHNSQMYGMSETYVLDSAIKAERKG